MFKTELGMAAEAGKGGSALLMWLHSAAGLRSQRTLNPSLAVQVIVKISLLRKEDNIFHSSLLDF